MLNAQLCELSIRFFFIFHCTHNKHTLARTLTRSHLANQLKPSFRLYSFSVYWRSNDRTANRSDECMAWHTQTQHFIGPLCVCVCVYPHFDDHTSFRHNTKWYESCEVNALKMIAYAKWEEKRRKQFHLTRFAFFKLLRRSTFYWSRIYSSCVAVVAAVVVGSNVLKMEVFATTRRQRPRPTPMITNMPSNEKRKECQSPQSSTLLYSWLNDLPHEDIKRYLEWSVSVDGCVGVVVVVVEIFCFIYLLPRNDFQLNFGSFNRIQFNNKSSCGSHNQA